jgi:hypothetical protein
MTDLRPYLVPSSAPLTGGARFIRGFARIGIVAAALVLLTGIVISVFIAGDAQRTAESKFEQAACVARLVAEKRPFKMKSYDQTEIDYGASGCPGWSYDDLESVLAVARAGSPAPLEYAVQPFFVGLFITIVSSVASFCGFWLIGWLCAGFTRD